MNVHRRVTASARMLGVAACAFFSSGEPKSGAWLGPSAHAQIIRNLIARLRGETLPDGVVKSNGRLEATQVRRVLQISGPTLRSDGGGGLQRHAGAGHRKDHLAGI